jgi:hypothetical protein
MKDNTYAAGTTLYRLDGTPGAYVWTTYECNGETLWPHIGIQRINGQPLGPESPRNVSVFDVHTSRQDAIFEKTTWLVTQKRNALRVIRTLGETLERLETTARDLDLHSVFDDRRTQVPAHGGIGVVQDLVVDRAPSPVPLERFQLRDWLYFVQGGRIRHVRVTEIRLLQTSEGYTVTSATLSAEGFPDPGHDEHSYFRSPEDALRSQLSLLRGQAEEYEKAVRVYSSQLNAFLHELRGESQGEPQSRVVELEYTNYRGETAERRFRPANLYVGSTEHHPEVQPLVRGYDVDRGVWRDFAVRGFSIQHIAMSEIFDALLHPEEDND